jgi:hypothetical protein
MGQRCYRGDPLERLDQAPANRQGEKNRGLDTDIRRAMRHDWQDKNLNNKFFGAHRIADPELQVQTAEVAGRKT